MRTRALTRPQDSCGAVSTHPALGLHARIRALSLSARRRGNWHVFCGRNVAACVTHEAGKFIYFYLGQTGFIIFASA